MLTKSDLKEIEKIVKPLSQGLGEVKANLEEVAETTSANAGSLMKIEQEIGAYKEGLQLQKERVDKHEKRLTTVEENLNLTN